MAKQNYNKQNFKPKTRAEITESVRRKAKENMHIIPVTTSDLVVYKSNDGTRPFYLVKSVHGVEGIYNISVQKLDGTGRPLTQVFETTMDKLERYWLQIGDRIMYERGRVSEEYKIKTIGGDALGELTIEVVNVLTGVTTLLDEKDLKYIDVIGLDE